MCGLECAALGAARHVRRGVCGLGCAVGECPIRTYGWQGGKGVKGECLLWLESGSFGVAVLHPHTWLAGGQGSEGRVPPLVREWFLWWCSAPSAHLAGMGAGE